MEAIVRTYTLYAIDPEGRAGLSENLTALDDAMAVEMAERRFRSGVVEVWERQRLVRRVEAPTTPE